MVPDYAVIPKMYLLPVAIEIVGLEFNLNGFPTISKASV